MLAVRTRVAAASVGSATTVTTAGRTTVSGNLLVAIGHAFGNSIGGTPISDSFGNTWVSAIAATGVTEGFATIFYAVNATGGAAHTFTLTTSSDFISLVVYEVEGAATSSVIGSTNNSTASTASHTSGSITANATVPEIFIGSMALSRAAEGSPVNVASYWSAGDSVLVAGATNEGYATSYRIVAANTSDSYAVTTGSVNRETIMIVGFKAASAGGGGTETAYPFVG